MPAVLKQYPDINVTINLTPSLLRQWKDYVSGAAFDRRVEVAKMDEASMSYENKSLVISYFFDINPQFVTGRYKYLQDKAAQYSTLEEKIAAFSNGDILDLKVMFFLRWINPYFIYNTTDTTISPVLKTLLQNLDGLIDSADPSQPIFTSSDRDNVLTAVFTIAQQVVPLHKELRDAGRLEITTTPFYHPILPLLVNLSSARETDPGNADLPLPKKQTGWTEDAQAQINKGVQFYTELFGSAPNGMWPSEEAVSDDIIPLVDNAGLNWMVTDEGVLRRGLGVTETTYSQLYQMYRVEKNGSSIAVLFRDPELSNLIGFTYSGMNPEDAATDFVNRLKARYNSLASAEQKDYIITVALDGENAWEHYSYDIDGDGKNEYTGNLFRELLYRKLTEAQNAGWLKTITPSQYIATHAINSLPLVDLATGSWAWDLNTWIGEPDENVAWDRLITARETLVAAENAGPIKNSTAAWEAIYAAEGSDWFWWYGTDQNSGRDELFDWGFKTLLRNVYENIGWTRDQILAEHPELFLKQKPLYSASFADRMTATIDGSAGTNEWDNAISYNDTETTDLGMKFAYIGIDQDTTKLLFRIDFDEAASAKTGSDDFVAVYFNNPRADTGEIFPLGVTKGDLSQTLGFELGYAAVYYFNTSSLVFYSFDPSAGVWDTGTAMNESKAVGNVLEFELSLSRLNYVSGDFFLTAITYVPASGGIDVAPQDGPFSIQVPLSGVDFNVIFEMDDPEGDEYGIYPTDESFSPGSGLFDILHFAIGTKDDQLVVSIKFKELTNPWNSPRGFSHPLIHVYFDKDRVDGSGSTKSMENANVDIDSRFAWEAMIKIDGWEAFGAYANETEFQGVDGIGDALEKTITITAPLSLIGTPTEDWAYVVIVGSQDFSQFREVLAENGQWKFGGGDDGPYDPNVIDMLVPSGADQNEILTSYDVATQTRAKIPGVGPKVSFIGDTEAPVVTIKSPTEGQEFKAGDDGVATINVNFTATDNQQVDHIDVFLDNVLVYDDLPGNTTSVQLKVEPGTHTIVINAYDGKNEETANFGTAKVTITVVSKEKGGFLSFDYTSAFLAIAVISPIFLLRKRKT